MNADTAGGARVLVVEDDADVRALLASHLRALGCRVQEAGTGEEALALAGATPPDVAVVDVLLPGIDGWQVAQRLRSPATARELPIVLTSVLDRDVLEVPGVLALPKPFSRADVERVVRPLLPRRPVD